MATTRRSIEQKLQKSMIELRTLDLQKPLERLFTEMLRADLDEGVLYEDLKDASAAEIKDMASRIVRNWNKLKKTPSAQKEPERTSDGEPKEVPKRNSDKTSDKTSAQSYTPSERYFDLSSDGGSVGY